LLIDVRKGQLSSRSRPIKIADAEFVRGRQFPNGTRANSCNFSSQRGVVFYRLSFSTAKAAD
jgi:hypothetical protein